MARELAKLARIANALNRTLVLPPLPCKKKKLRWCNLCTFDKFVCFSREVQKFANPVKESVFFTNPRVPPAIVRENEKNPIYSFDANCKSNVVYASDFPAHKNNHNVINCVPCRKKKEACIIEEGLKTKSLIFKVLSIDCCVSYTQSALWL